MSLSPLVSFKSRFVTYFFKWFIPVVCEKYNKEYQRYQVVRSNTTLLFVDAEQTDYMFRPLSIRPSSGLARGTTHSHLQLCLPRYHQHVLQRPHQRHQKNPRRDHPKQYNQPRHQTRTSFLVRHHHQTKLFPTQGQYYYTEGRSCDGRPLLQHPFRDLPTAR